MLSPLGCLSSEFAGLDSSSVCCSCEANEVDGMDDTAKGGNGGGNDGVVLDFDGIIVLVEEFGRDGQD